MADPVVVFVANDFPQAHLLRAALESRGIGAFVQNEPLTSALGEIPLGWATAPRLLVAAGDEARARAALRELGEDA